MILRLVRAMLKAPSLIPSVFTGKYSKTPIADIAAQVQRGEAQIVDVRELGEWNRGHVDGAEWFPLSEMAQGIDDDAYVRDLKARLPHDKVLYTHCLAGGRSLIAAEALGRLGYKVKALKQGYRTLVKGGMPDSKADGSSDDAAPDACDDQGSCGCG